MIAIAGPAEPRCTIRRSRPSKLPLTIYSVKVIACSSELVLKGKTNPEPSKLSWWIDTTSGGLIAGFASLLNPVSYAEFSIYPELVISGNIEQTVQNITAQHGLFVVAILCYLGSFIGDVRDATCAPPLIIENSVVSGSGFGMK